MKSNINSETLIAALQKPEAFSHPCQNIELRETHISWVILSGEYAYKIKKPMNFGFLDFSSLAKRKHYCEEELRLNSRFAPEIYRAVVPIALSDGKIVMNGEGEIVDYAVQMVQFETSQLLDKQAEAGTLDDKAITAIGKNIALFHQQIAAEDLPPADFEPQPGSPAAVWAPIKENFEQIAVLINDEKVVEQAKRVQVWSEQHFAQLESLIAKRKAEGKVRDCHGDLHLGNMIQIDKRFLFFDCIEFNQSFRQIDIACEIAFTVMDLEARGMPEAANLLLNTYLEQGGDYEGLQLVTFYKVYFAVVRAKVSIIHLTGSDPEDIKRHENYPVFCKYIALAASYAQTPKSFVALTSGVSGSGKSTAAAKIAARTGAIRLRSDVERKRLFGLAPEENSHESIYTSEASEQTFAKLLKLLEQVTASGFPCIVDATFLKADLRQSFNTQAQNASLPFHILHCHATEEELVNRIERRQKKSSDASEATVEIMQQQRKNTEAFSNEEMASVINIDTQKPLEIDMICAELQKT